LLGVAGVVLGETEVGEAGLVATAVWDIGVWDRGE